MTVTIGRRELLAALGGAAAWPLAARAQQTERVRRIGLLMVHVESDQEGQTLAAAFREGLLKSGWTEGRNIRIDTRWAGGDRTPIRASSPPGLVCGWPLPGKRSFGVQHRGRLQSCVRPVGA